jgi:RHS repeat-associated protein
VWNSYGLRGERLDTQSFGLQPIIYNGQLYGYYGTETVLTQNIYFAGRLIASNGTTVATDRMGSTRLDENGNRAEYFPYGETFSSSLSVPDLFGTYARDSGSELDYANQRYYTSTYGRFTTPDRYEARARGANNPGSPGSWNRYGYVQGDPANGADRRGMYLDAQECIGNPDACVAENEAEASLSASGCVYMEGEPIYCNDSGPAGVDSRHPTLPMPQCSISLYERSAGGSPGNHTYLDVSGTVSGQ